MRLLSRGHVYARLAPDALLESEYERLFVQEGASLFPRHRVVEFRKTVESEYGSNQADFALIHHDYKEWWVVEVELAHHSFEGHVLPQVQSLASALYAFPEAQYLASKDNRLDEAKLSEMMLGAQPRVLVVVNKERADWRPALAAFGAHMIVAEVFRSALDAHALLVHGALPELSDALVSKCVPEPLLGKSFLAVESPAALDVKNGEIVEVEFEGNLTRWRRIDVHDRVWLYPNSGDGLPRGMAVDLNRSDSGRLFFKKSIGRPNRGT